MLNILMLSFNMKIMFYIKMIIIVIKFKIIVYQLWTVWYIKKKENMILIKMKCVSWSFIIDLQKM